MKIYTGTGDRGQTSLFSGERVAKSDERIAAYGDVDELNSSLGALVAALAEKNPDLTDRLRQIQTDLFQLSAILAVTPDSPAMDSLAEITDSQIMELEEASRRPKSRGWTDFSMPWESGMWDGMWPWCWPGHLAPWRR